MANSYSRETAASLGAAAYAKSDGRVLQAKLKRLRATIDYDGQANGDTITLGKLPPGASFAFGVITAKATFGAAATLAIGVVGDATAFRAAAIFTAVDTPTLFGIAEDIAAAPFTEEKTVIATVGAAAAPNSADYLVVDIFYSDAV
ncbi:hypothetical protein [Sphingopyxis terrae]|uniref:hypothetical protein n=1 Tax=Sphingopyxis terrae TaxID=33052 RepID=UPI003F7D7A98